MALDTQRLAHIRSLQRPGEAEALYDVALQSPQGVDMVELGTFHGYTAAVLALAGLDHDAYVTTIDDYAPRYGLSVHIGAEGVRKNLVRCGLDGRVNIVEGDTRIVPGWIHEIGLLWIDSTHTAEQMRAELAAWLPGVVVGGIVACHDYGGANTPQLKPVIDETFGDRATWQQIGAYHTLIAFKRIQ